jgi:hypothetical protein
VLVKYTYFGDADLNGSVDGSDYSRIDNGYLASATGWFNGDFNYDDIINGSDYTLIDNAFNRQGTLLAAQIASLPATHGNRVRPIQITVPASVFQSQAPIEFNGFQQPAGELLSPKKDVLDALSE